MQWVIDNWLLLLFGGGMVAMHLFGHGGHGKHGGQGGRDKKNAEKAPETERSATTIPPSGKARQLQPDNAATEEKSDGR